MSSPDETAARPLPRYPTPRSPIGAAKTVPRPWLQLVILALLVKGLLVGLTLAIYGASPDPLSALGREWDRWDATHYLYLASHGYGATGDARNLIAFFPLYPALLAAVASVGLPARIGAVLISNITGVIAAIVLFEVARVDGDDRAAWRAAALFTVFPTAYFLLVGYTEALFCALAFASVLLLRRRQWLGAGMLGGLAAATRLTGLALIPGLLLHAVSPSPGPGEGSGSGRLKWTRPGWKVAGAAALMLLGFLVYLATNQLVLGNPFAFLGVQRQHWSHSLAPPWVGFASAISSLSWRSPWEKLTVVGGEILGGIVAYAASTLSWLRLRPADAVYATVLTVMVTFLPFWLSIPRYLLAMYPLFLLAGRITSRWIYLGLVTLSLIALVVFGLAFGRGYWAF